MTNQQKQSSYEYLLWQDSTGLLTFYRDVSDEFSSDTGLQSSDIALAASIADAAWTYLYFMDIDGQTYQNTSGLSIYYSDGTFEDTFDGTTSYGTWYISNGGLYCDYDDGSDSSSWPIEIKTENGINYLYFYSSDEPAYWLYSDQPMVSDLSSQIFDIIWYSSSIKDSDGTITHVTEPDAFAINSDGTFLYTGSDGSTNTGTWEVIGDTYYEYFDDSSIENAS